MLIGHLDDVDGSVALGWALDTSDLSAAVSLNVFIDGELVGRALADRHRDDLMAEYNSASHGFRWRIPEEWLDGAAHELAVATPFENKFLAGSPRTFACRPPTASMQNFVSSNLVSIRPASFAKQNAGIALFAVNEAGGRLRPYRREILAAVADAGFDVVVTNSSTANRQAFERDAGGVASCIITRGDLGRDFASWVVTMTVLEEAIGRYDYVLWLNDSVYGPYRPLRPIVDNARSSKAALSGLTESWEGSHHLQSYFLLFKREAFQDRALHGFLTSYRFPEEKADIIKEGEVALGKALASSALPLECCFPYDQVAARWLDSLPSRLRWFESLPESRSGTDRVQDGVLVQNRGHAGYGLDWTINVASDIRQLRPLNPTHFFWDTLIKDFSFPFVKRELLIRNPSGVPNLSKFGEVVGQLTEVQCRALLENLRSDLQGTTPPLQIVPNQPTPHQAIAIKIAEPVESGNGSAELMPLSLEPGCVGQSAESKVTARRSGKFSLKRSDQ